jgi:alcohol dehydrogenase
MLLKSVLSGRLKPKKLITHEFKLHDMMKAYDTFGDAAAQKALKMILHAV